MQLTNFNLASLWSFSSMLGTLDSKYAFRCFVGIFLSGKGIPKFFPRLIVFATTGRMRVSVKLVNQESVRQP